MSRLMLAAFEPCCDHGPRIDGGTERERQALGLCPNQRANRPGRGYRVDDDCVHWALEETRAMKQTARRNGKPLGYTWPLWNEAREPRFVPEPLDAVVHRQLAYKPAGYTWRLWHRGRPVAAVQAARRAA